MNDSTHTPSPNIDEASNSNRKHKQGSLHFKFKGTAVDYYRIYAANTLLTVITLGIYSSWAKVRNKRFFYGNTYLGKHNFDYDAKPITMLIARFIVLAFMTFLAVSISLALSYSRVALEWGINTRGIVLLILFCFLPLVVVSSRNFDACHTTHRSVRFNYDTIYMPSVYLFLAYLAPAIILLTFVDMIPTEISLLHIILAVVAMYLVFFTPAYFYYKHRIQINQFKFGTLCFAYRARLRDYYKIAFVSVILALVILIITYIFAFSVSKSDSEFLFILFFALPPPLFVLVLIGTFRCCIVALFFSSIELDEGSRIISKIRAKELFLKYLLVNIVAIIFTLGILLPWVRVRTWRYVTEQISFLPSHNTGVVLAGPNNDISPIAGELADISDIDVDFSA